MKDCLNYIFAGVMVLFALALGACHDEPIPDDGNVEYRRAKGIGLSNEQKLVADKTSDFANELFNLTSQNKGDENFIISPLGASMVLSMIANASAGNTRDEILNALRIEEGDIDCLNSINKKLMTQLPLPENTACDIDVNNSFWYNKENVANLNPAFVRVLSDDYMADVYAVNKDEFVPKVNQWVAKHTESGVNDFLKENEVEDLGCVFLNTFNFSGAWYEKGGLPTSIKTFHSANGNSRDLTFIEFENSDGAWSTGYCYVVNFYYNGNSNGDGCTFRLIFPYEDVDIDEALSTYKEFMADPLNKYYFMFGEELLNFNTYLPKFSIETAVDLMPVLKQMGVNDVFDKDKCNFDNIAVGAKGFISLFKQTTKLSVDEKGTKVQTATTGSGMLSGAVARPFPKELIVDRPFAFEICVGETGITLIQGRVNNL